MNIILTGFMGTGKTSVACELQKILGLDWELLDTDELIVKKEDRAITEIFVTDGEEYFRDVEAKIIEEVSSYDKKIISTGGGAVLRAENIKNLKKNGMVVCLEAAPEKIFERLKTDNTRPLLKVENPLAKIKEMLEIRKQYYENNNYAIDTTELSVEEIAKKIMDLKPEAIRVNLKENSYNILVGKSYTEIVNWLPEVRGRKILIITDSNFIRTNEITPSPLEAEYLKNLKSTLKNKGYIVNYHIIAAGEQYKNLDEINEIYKSCVENGLDRGSLIIALGGGVVGDMAGFAAATYLRGINYIQIPTTLLAQVDASIGGKTGIDLPFGKNLVGAFHQPKLVWIDPNFLKTLDDREYKNGLAEVVKYGVIYENCNEVVVSHSEFHSCHPEQSEGSRIEMFRSAQHDTKIQDDKEKDLDFWVFLETNIDKILARNDSEILKNMLYLCAKAKANVVSQDEKEGNLRKILNFGHTLGHAMETYQNYDGLKHGEAVAFGMAFAAYIAVRMEICDKSVETRLLELINKTGFEIQKWKAEIFKSDMVCDEVIGFMSHDKKMAAGKVDFILPTSLGKVKIMPLELEFVKKMLIDWGK